MPGPGFAVIDVQTTGLFPKKRDRVVELAIVLLDRAGRVTGSWETLVNPERDLGEMANHGILPTFVTRAPTFAQVAPSLVDLLAGRVLVAHNASYQTSFVYAELKKAGYPLPVEPTVFCTMQLAREFLPKSARSLHECSELCGIPLDDPHRASSNAMATAALLSAYIAHSPTWSAWGENLTRADVAWPGLGGERADWFPRGKRIPGSATFLQRISTKLPGHTGPAEELDYLALLDRALLDQELSAEEADGLVELAESLGLSRERCDQLHSMYFDQLAAAAWADGVLSLDEMGQLISIGSLLSMPADTVRSAMDKAQR